MSPQACPWEGHGHTCGLGAPHSGQLGFAAHGDLLAAVVMETDPWEGPLVSVSGVHVVRDL